jgi:hypothetical protein
LQRTLPFLLASIALASAGCGGVPDVVASDPTVAQAEGKDEAAMCQSAYDRENPLIIEWPGTEKVALESIAKRGLVMVRYEGCKLQILHRCEVKGSYGFDAVTVHRDTLEIKDDKDLFTRMPRALELAQGRARERQDAEARLRARRPAARQG